MQPTSANATPMTQETATQQLPLLLTADAAARLCSTSLRVWRQWDAAGKIPQAIRIGRRPLWRLDELKAWIAAGCPNRITWHAIRD